jgi:hypothetical protein
VKAIYVGITLNDDTTASNILKLRQSDAEAIEFSDNLWLALQALRNVVLSAVIGKEVLQL